MGLRDRAFLGVLVYSFARVNGRTPWQAFQEGLPRRPKTNRTAEQEERKTA